jgi:hypothetical protein
MFTKIHHFFSHLSQDALICEFSEARISKVREKHSMHCKGRPAGATKLNGDGAKESYVRNRSLERRRTR